MIDRNWSYDISAEYGAVTSQNDFPADVDAACGQLFIVLFAAEEDVHQIRLSISESSSVIALSASSAGSAF